MQKKGIVKKHFLPLKKSKGAALEERVSNGIRLATCETNPERSIGIILEVLGKELGGDRAYIFEKNPSGGDDNTYEWTAEGAVPQKNGLQDLPARVCEKWYRAFGEGKCVVFDEIEDMLPSGALQYQYLKKQDIHSIAVVPLYNDERVIGFYGIDNPPAGDMEPLVDVLRSVAYFIESMIKRRDITNRLREIGLRDRLTNLGNRYALDEFVSDIENARGLGVVFCDITGLKRTNDTMGHKAGDELIQRAAESLRLTFGERGLFRFGGDELLAICADIDEEVLKGRVERLRKLSADNSVNLAVGVVWENGFRGDIQELLNKAEKLMYKEKDEYYRTTGIDRRR